MVGQSLQPLPLTRSPHGHPFAMADPAAQATAVLEARGRARSWQGVPRRGGGPLLRQIPVSPTSEPSTSLVPRWAPPLEGGRPLTREGPWSRPGVAHGGGSARAADQRPAVRTGRLGCSASIPRLHEDVGDVWVVPTEPSISGASTTTPEARWPAGLTLASCWNNSTPAWANSQTAGGFADRFKGRLHGALADPGPLLFPGG